MNEVKLLIAAALLTCLAGCGGTWNSAARSDSSTPWRSNPHDTTIALQTMQRLPSPPYSKVSLSEEEKLVRPLGPMTTQNCAGVQVLQLVKVTEEEGEAVDERRELAIWEYEVRRAGGNRIAYVSRLRDRTDIPMGEELDQEITACRDRLVEHYNNAGAPLVDLDGHPMARAIDLVDDSAN
ncbi:MAG: hypothetical protein AAFR65_06735 [Pseudomonadota bacterium]